MQEVNWTALIIFILLFGFITWLGFAAANWRKGDLDLLHEWGLGGRRFGTIVTWFLIGGDLYTAYTFIAVPALAFGAGAVAFFAVPYTIVAYPIFFLVFPRIWHVCHKHHYITAADFVRGRFGNRWLALAVTITGIVATMPYIALQLVGLQVVIAALGVSGTGFAADLPLIIAFVLLAAFTYSSGLRAASSRLPPGSATFPNTPPASSSSATISRCRRSFCTASRHGLSASPLRRSGSAPWCRQRSCRSPRPTSTPAISTANSSTGTRPTSKKRRWRNGYR